MIYEDVYQFLMTKSSAKEFDVVLNLINHIDWNSTIHIDFYRLAKLSGTKVKYVKEIFKKFTSPNRGKKIISQNKYDNTYTLLLGKSSLLYNKGDKYCKKYSFLYSEEFQKLSIYAKRVLLAAAMQISSTNQQKSFLYISDFIFNNGISSGLIPNKKALYRTIEEINGAFRRSIVATIVTNFKQRKEMIFIEFDKDVTNKVKQNHTEREILRESLFEYGFFEVLPEEHYIELEKTGKYIFNSLFRYAKEARHKNKKVQIGLIDDVLKLSRDIYNQSIERLAQYLTKNNFQNKRPDELSAYFSSVVYSVIFEEHSKIQHQIASLQKLFEHTMIYGSAQEIKNKQEYYLVLTSILEKWCEDWVISRAQVDLTGDPAKNNEKLNALQRLKSYINQNSNLILDKIRKQANVIFNQEEKESMLERFHKRIVELIDDKTSRLEVYLLS